MGQTVLIVDDEPTQRRLLEYVIGDKLGFRTVALSGGHDAIDYLLSGKQPVPDVVLLDLSMPKVSGMDVLRAVRPLRPQLPIIALTAQGEIEKAVEAMRAGAGDFLAKPIPVERLNVSITNTLKLGWLNQELARLQRHTGGQVFFTDLVGASPTFRQAVQLGQRAASAEGPVFILGEAGTGKELFARAIHGCSRRTGHPFVTVSCTGLTEASAEAILFGYERGTLPGVPYRGIGKIAEAGEGTLFLDDIETLPLPVQMKLALVLAHGEYVPTSGRVPMRARCRFIASSRTNVNAMAASGDFRQDLLDRLQAQLLRVPALRERREDIALLARHFLERFAALENKPVRGITPTALALLTGHGWAEGNVRALENTLYRAVVFSDALQLDCRDFQHLQRRVTNEPTLAATAISNTEPPLYPEIPYLRLVDERGNVRPMAAVEAELIRFALKHYSGHISEAARRLGIGRSTLYRKMNDFGIAANAA